MATQSGVQGGGKYVPKKPTYVSSPATGLQFAPPSTAPRTTTGSTAAPAYQPGGSTYNQQVPKAPGTAGPGHVPVPVTSRLDYTLTSKNPAYTLQKQLQGLGYDIGKADGVIGAKTIAAIKAFQRANGLTPDGIAGPKTIAALNSPGVRPAGSVPSGSSGDSHRTSPGGGSVASAAPSVASPSVNPPKYSPQQKTQNTQDLLKQFHQNASLQTDAQLNPQINSLQRAIDLLNAQYGRQSAEVGQRKGIAQGDLTALFDRTTNYLGNLQTTQDAQYARGGVDVSELYNQLRSSISGNYDRAEQQTNNEAARLGLQEATPATTASMNDSEAWLRNMANANQANSLNTLGTMRQGFDDLMSFQRGNAQQEKATAVSQSNRDYDKQLNELMNTYNDQTYDLTGQRRDIEGTRGAKIQEIIDALTANHQEGARADEQAAFERWLAEQGLALDNAKFQHETAYDYDKMLMDAQLAAAAPAAAVKPPEYRGNSGAYQYLSTVGASPKVTQLFNDYLGSAYNKGGGDMGYMPEGYKTTLAQELQRHAQRVGLTPAELAALQDAIRYAGKV